MAQARTVLEEELDQLAAQRQRYVLAARAGQERGAVLRHLLNAERLAEEIQVIRDALAHMPVDDEDVTIPIVVGDETTTIYRST
jgi:hypothetical protein